MARVKLTPRQAFLLMCACANPHGTVYVPSHDRGHSSVTWKGKYVRNVLGYGLVEAKALAKRDLMTEKHSVFTVTEAGRAALALRADLVKQLEDASDEATKREQERLEEQDRVWYDDLDDEEDS